MTESIERDARHKARMARKKTLIDEKIAQAQDEYGLLLVHSGNGKGKSSSAFGMVARALGHGLKVGVVQFIKGAASTGEETFFRRFPDEVSYHVMGEGFTWETQDRQRDIDKAREMVREVSDRYNLNLDPDSIIEDLPVGVQQRVEIVKVLLRDAKVVVFDEPTAVLTPKEIIEFFEIVKTLIAAGRGVVFITHKLKEALNVADRIAVLRRGQVVGEVDPKTATESQIAEMMVGRPVQLIVDKKPHAPGEVVLEVKDLSVLDADGRTMVDSVSFSVRAGEVVGIAGVQGNGQTELVDALTGLRNSTRGRVALDGQDITSASPRVRHAKGIAHIPEDRQRQGLVGGLSVAENLVLTRYHDEEFSNGIIMDWPAAHHAAENLIAEYDVRTPSPDIEANTLSGGNQQKVIVARELSRPLRLSIAAQPTRGVDVGSIEYIHSRIIKERDTGTAVLIVSTELDEVMALSDRLFVMYRGKIVADLDPKVTSAMDVGLYMAGSRPTNTVNA